VDEPLDKHALLALASDVSLVIADSADLGGMLTTVAQRTAQAFGVWECNIYEYRPEQDALVATAVWAQELTDRDRQWVGTVYPMATRPSYKRLLEERVVREYQLDDPVIGKEDRELMELWGERSVLSVPLVFQDVVIGALTLIEKRARRTFTAEDLRSLGIMAVPAAVAVQNARLLRREASQNKRLQALLAASRAMTTTIRLDDLLAAIARAAREALDADECLIERYHAESDTITVVAHEARPPERPGARFLGRELRPPHFAGARDALLRGEILDLVRSDESLGDDVREWLFGDGALALQVIPLIYETEPIGLLVFLERQAERRLSDEERELAAALGEQAAAAIHHAELLQQTERQNRQLGLLLESTRAISTTVELDEVLAIVARTTAEALGAEQCQIQEYDATANTVTPVAFWQRHDDRPEPDSMHKTFSLENEPDERRFLEANAVVQQLFSDPALAAPTRATMEKYGDLSYLNIPLVFGGQSFGVMVLVETEWERRWSDDDVALGRALGEQAATAIEHARLYRRVQDQAITDGLTGLFNHRYFYERLEQEIARARRYGTPVSLLMIDIDDFKAFNDRHGHLAGDAVLREMAEVLGTELRAKLDIAARYGGEEFAVILPNTPMAPIVDTQMEMDLAGKLSRLGEGEAPPAPGHRQGAEGVAERIRRRIASTHFVSSDSKGPAGLTVSIGVAVFPQRTTSAEDLVANADAALYKAKRAGKDRVESFG